MSLNLRGFEMNLNENKLSRYFKVSKNRLQAQFLISSSISVNFKSESTIEELWKLHDEAMNLFREKITSQNEVEPTSPSLLDLKIAISNKMLEKCIFCERRCKTNRKKKQIGYCRLEAVSRYSSEFLHQGEEDEIVPSHTIFLTGCNFLCNYCQNWQISTSPQSGNPIIPNELAKIITLRRMYGSRNVNFVTPTPHLHTILKVLNFLKTNIPIIWNSNMYYSKETSKLLEGVVDLYLGDLRYGNDECAKKYSQVSNYWNVVTDNFKSAYKNGEIILRHLVLPTHLECCTEPIINWTKENIPKIKFNLMFQYYPHFRAYEHQEINRTLTSDECKKATESLKKSGLG